MLKTIDGDCYSSYRLDLRVVDRFDLVLAIAGGNIFAVNAIMGSLMRKRCSKI